MMVFSYEYGPGDAFSFSRFSRLYCHTLLCCSLSLSLSHTHTHTHTRTHACECPLICIIFSIHKHTPAHTHKQICPRAHTHQINAIACKIICVRLFQSTLCSKLHLTTTTTHSTNNSTCQSISLSATSIQSHNIIMSTPHRLQVIRHIKASDTWRYSVSHAIQSLLYYIHITRKTRFN